MMNYFKSKKYELIKWLDKHMDDCPCDWYEGLNDGEIIFILEEVEQ